MVGKLLPFETTLPKPAQFKRTLTSSYNKTRLPDQNQEKPLPGQEPQELLPPRSILTPDSKLPNSLPLTIRPTQRLNLLTFSLLAA